MAWGGFVCHNTCVVNGTYKSIVKNQMFKARNSFLSSFGICFGWRVPPFYVFLLEKNIFCPKISMK